MDGFCDTFLVKCVRKEIGLYWIELFMHIPSSSNVEVGLHLNGLVLLAYDSYIAY